MDKNKNRTDLLAAGRKKLQQYRQKKDGKGSKSSGKANKPDPDVITDESSSVAKPIKGKKQSPVPAQDSATESVDSSNADMATPDLSSTSDLPSEISETDVSINTSVSDENLQSSNLNDAMPTDLSLKSIDIEGKPESDHVSTEPVDNFAGKSGDVEAACGEDQVPDVGATQELDHSPSVPDNTVSSIHVEKDDRDQVKSGELEEDTKMEHANSAAEQTSEHGPQSSGPGYTIQPKEDDVAYNYDDDDDDDEDDVAGFHDDGGVKLPHRSGDSEFIPASLTQLAKALKLLSEDELKFVLAAREAVNDGGMKPDPAELPERLKEQLYINNFEKELTYLQFREEWDARKKIESEKSSLATSLRDVEGKNKVFSEELAACQSELDRVRGEMEKLQIELKRSEDELSNVSSELVDSRNLLSELQLKQENLSVNVFLLTEEKHSLEKEKEDLNMENEKFKKELMECKSLLELSQAENVNFKESLAKLEEEKEKYVSEYEHFVNENKKFSMESIESQDLVESLRSEIAKLNENLELVTKEETRLREEVNRLIVEKEQALAELTNCQSLLELSQAETVNLNEQFAHSSMKVSMELSESQHLVEGLQEKIAKLSESLDLVTKEKTRLEEEEVNHLTVEKEEKEGFAKETKKFSLELLESQELVESLRSEISKLNDNLELVTKEETRLGEEVKQLTTEKEEAFTELTNCRSLLELSHAETANLNEQFAQSSKKVSLELSESQLLVEGLQEKIAKLSESLDLVSKEKTKLEEVNHLAVEKEEKEGFVKETKKFSLELLESKELVESLRSEIAKLNENLELVAKEETRLGEEVKQLTIEKEAALTELTNCRSLLESSHAETASLNEQFAQSSKEVPLEFSESQQLVERLHAEIAKSSANLDLVTKEKSRLVEEVNRLTVEVEEKDKKFSLELSESQDLVEGLRSEIAKLKENLESVTKEETRLGEEVKQLTVEKEEALTELTNCRSMLELSHAENANLNEQFALSSKEVALEYVESQHLVESLHAEIAKSCENLDLVTKEKTRLGDEVNCLAVEKEEKEDVVKEIKKLSMELLESKELVESLRSEIAKLNENAELATKEETRLREEMNQLTVEKEEALTELTNFRYLLELSHAENAKLNEQFVHSSKEVSLELSESRQLVERLQAEIAKLSENLDLVTKEKIRVGEEVNRLTVEKEEALAELSNCKTLINDLQVEYEETFLQKAILDEYVKQYVFTVEVKKGELVILCENLRQEVITSIQELLEQVDELQQQADHMTETNKDLESTNELASYVIHKVFDNLQKLVEDSGQSTEQSEDDTAREQLDHLEISNYDVFIERQIMFFEDIQSSVTLNNIEIKPDEPLSSLESITHFLINNLKFNETKVIDLQNEIDHLTSSIVSHEIQSHVLKESLITAMEQIVNLQSDTQSKETEFGQSEQRNLAATSSELEKCLHELQLKDATLQETEAKLRTYSEAGERMEALESELSYIRNSATALRESFLLKDSVLQRIEETLEDLDLPEDFHDRDIIDKIDWDLDGWREVLEPSSGLDDELRRNYEELQNKFYGLAEHNEMLEQSLMERNNLVQRWEEVLDKINIPSQFRSLEPEDRIEWLRVALLETNDQSQRRLVDIESTLKAVTDEREQLSASLEAQGRNYNEISEKATLYKTENEKLKIEVDTLHSKLDEKRVDEEQIHHIHGEIRRLRGLVKEMLQVSEIEDLDSNTSDIQCLEGLLKKLADKHITQYEERSLDQSNMHEELERKLEAVEGDLVQVKDERERLVEKSQTLTDEIEALEVKNQELKNLLLQEEQNTAAVKEELERKLEAVEGDLEQAKDERERLVEKIQTLTSEVEALELKNQELKNLLVQEEQKTATVKEKLNVAVRKGKSLVQVRDSMKQTINELTSQVERLNGEIKARENTILEFQQKMQDLFVSQELVENKDSEIQFLKNRLYESENELVDKRKTMSMILGALAEIELGVDSRTNDPFEKMKQNEKSKRAAELLLAELNEVQERNEDLLEEISELSRQRDSAEASKRESQTRFEQLSALHSEERSSQFSELVNLKSGDASNVGGQTLKTSRSESKFKSFLDSKTEELHSDSTIIDLWRFVGSHMQDLLTNINSLEEKLQNHSKSLREEAILLCEKVPTLFKEITSHKRSLESANEEIAWLESTGKQKETEILMLRKYISILYEACKNSVLEIEKSKGQMVADDSFVEDIIGGETVSVSEEDVTSIVNRLLSAVKDIHTEATAMSHLQELESAKAHVDDLKDQCNVLEQRVKELEGQESVLVDLQEKVKSLTEAMTAKEQENEALLQALDEEEAQMEDLTNKITELEQVVKQKNLDLESAESARGKALKKLSVTVSKFDELHLSETLVSEVDKLQSQLQERDSEISFLRDEITRITSESLQTLKTDERGLTEFQDILTWLDSMASGVETRDVNLDDNKNDQVQEYKEILKKQITNIISELKDTRQVAQIKDVQLHAERSKVEELTRSLREKET
ncbi:uncharacterized protein LOC143604345 [Bidens hawaiensis]|uniref:uncharacterized protein LOC143604345 n=1 Tax=Bidens hawaiensis TaxID=980011 RepID=UPI00404ACCFD